MIENVEQKFWRLWRMEVSGNVFKKNNTKEGHIKQRQRTLWEL